MSDTGLSKHFTPYVRRVLIALGLAAVVIVLLFTLWRLGEALLVMFASGLFAVFLSGCATWIRRRTSLGYGWCVLIVVMILAALIVGAAGSLGVQVAQQATQLYQGLNDSLQQVQAWLERSEWGSELLKQAEQDQLRLTELTAPATRLLRRAVAAIALGIVILVVGIYLAGNPELYTRGALRLIPIGKRPRGQEVLDAVGLALQGWLLAEFVSMTIIGTLVAVGLWLFGIELWLILGLLAGLLTFIPNLGPIIAGIPPILLALNQSPWLALGVLGYFTAVQFLEGYLITPMVQQRVIRLPPAAILSVQLLMGYAFGLLGIALAAPLLAAMMVIVEMLYVQDLLGDQDIEVTGQDAHLLPNSTPDTAQPG